MPVKQYRWDRAARTYRTAKLALITLSVICTSVFVLVLEGPDFVANMIEMVRY